MRPTRTVQILTALVVGLGVLVAAAVPAPAAVHDYDFAIDDLTFGFYGPFQTTPELTIDWPNVHQCSESTTLSIDDVAETMEWTLDLEGVIWWYSSWAKFTLHTTMSDAYVGGFYIQLIQVETSLTLEIEEVSGPTDCSPDSGVICTVTAAEADLNQSTGWITSNDHGVGELAPTDTVTFASGNTDFHTTVTGTGCSLGVAVDGGRFEIDLEASGFS